MSDAERLAKIERAYDAAVGGVYDDIHWLIARVRELEADKARQLTPREAYWVLNDWPDGAYDAAIVAKLANIAESITTEKPNSRE